MEIRLNRTIGLEVDIELDMFKVLSQQLRGTLTTAFKKHLTSEDFRDLDQYRCQACTKIFDLLLYASVSLKQS